MNTIHKNYNLEFTNKTVDGLVDKTVSLKNPKNKTYVGIMFYLAQVVYLDDIDSLLTEVNKAIAGQSFDDAIEVGSEQITLTQNNVTLIDQGKTAVIPTNDFKSILEEWKTFIQTPPLNGSKAIK